MCQTVIENTFLTKVENFTRHVPVVNQTVDRVMQLLVPPSVVANAACAADTNTSGTKYCISNGRGFDSLVSPQPCNGTWKYGYVNYFMWIVYINGQKRSFVDYNQRSCSTWNCKVKSCHPGSSDNPCNC